ncbi:unnamed protein product [Diatraea saccharalis]|uniref:Beta-glucosidase n=1 Tax=Diatraea saccharalis TaxID=40085 RepID=A0A9N9QVN6_9NEOP|nr:unnamed protein product [Diatraea saccharalis]
MTHNYPSTIEDLTNGDVADDSYNQYKRDVEMMRELGLQFYRFSLSWPRILPTGFPNKLNEPGIQYYNNLIDEMLKYNIEPMITLYHWDLPQRLQELGGWANPHIADWFADYARVAFENYGDRVKYWITINEPYDLCAPGYGDGFAAPMVVSKGIGEYMCAKNLLIAHSKAYHIYDKEFRYKTKGIIGISLSAKWHEPESEDDTEIADHMRQFQFGQFAHPIFSENGDFPPIMKEKIATKSAEQGFSRSRLPEFTADEIKLLKGSADFLGLNHYTTQIIRQDASATYDVPSFWDDIGGTTYQLDEWESTASPWLKVVPWGFYKILNKIKETYDNPTIIITENGLPTFGGLDDDNRVAYLRSYIGAMLDAMDDGCNIIGYAAWSLMDNFEWIYGYRVRFGLYEVDHTSPNRTRTPRKSAFVYKEIVRTRTLDTSYEPDTNLMTIDEGH